MKQCVIANYTEETEWNTEISWKVCIERNEMPWVNLYNLFPVFHAPIVLATFKNFLNSTRQMQILNRCGMNRILNCCR